MREASMSKYVSYPVAETDYEPGSDHMVSEAAVRRAIAKATGITADDAQLFDLIGLGDDFWFATDADLAVLYEGSWYVDGPNIDVLIDATD
jgi:hypothetical protein